MPTMMKTHQPAPALKQHRPTPRLPYDRRWMRLRKMVLAQSPFCVDPLGVHAKHGERLVPAQHVDHILPKRQGGTDSLENLQTLCASCHARKTALYDGGFGRQRGAARGSASGVAVSAVDRGPSSASVEALSLSSTDTSEREEQMECRDSGIVSMHDTPDYIDRDAVPPVRH